MTTSPNIPDKDSALIKACKKELPYTTTVFEELVRKYEPTVLNTCQYLLMDPDDAEETSQDVFIRVFHHLKKFNQKSTFRTWLFRIVRNCCYTRIKQREKQTIFRKDILPNSDCFIEKSENSFPVNTNLEEALRKLSSEERELITLRFISELSLKEISESMGIQLSATKMRFYRALEILKKELKH